MASISSYGAISRRPDPHAFLRHRHAGADKCVAIFGTEGLAHMAIRIARATGAEVSVLNPQISATDRLWMGADHYFATTDPVTHRALEGAFDLIVCTVADADIRGCLGLLKWDGALLVLETPLAATPAGFIENALTFCGLATG